MSDIPEMIGKYKIVSEIARGGMGTVYKAVHPTLRRHVIIKKLTMRTNAAVRERFKREARILLDLHHANIVHMFDYFTEASFHYIVLEYVDGMSLDKYLKIRTKLSVPTALLIFREACLALKYAHDTGIVHRDIKPGNILISQRGEIKLADFGIASTEKEEENEELTREGTTLGTPSYMPPEQFGDSKNVDKRADIYAMGIMLYEMVTGLKPFPGSFSPETILQIQKGKYTAPEKIDDTLSPFVCRLIKKMIRPNPRRRFQDISQVLDSIQKHLRQYEIDEIRSSLSRGIMNEKYEEPVFVVRNKGLKIAAAVLISAVCLAAGSYYAWESGQIHRVFLKPWFTPVSLSMSLPSSAANDSDLPMRAFFFIDNNKDIPEVEDTRRVFIPDTRKFAQNTSSTQRYRTKPVYLKPGSYRIKVVSGAYVWWQSVLVSDKDTHIPLDFLKNSRRSVSFNLKAADTVQKTDLTNSALFSVMLNNSWVPIEQIKQGMLSSGTVYQIRVSAPGYETEIFSLRVEWYQDEIYISAGLDPIKK